MKVFRLLLCLTLLLGLSLTSLAQTRVPPIAPTLYSPFDGQGFFAGTDVYSFAFEHPANVDSFALDVDGTLTADVINVTNLVPGTNLNCWGTPGNGGCEYILNGTEQAALVTDEYSWSVTATNVDGSTTSEIRGFVVNPDLPGHFGLYYPTVGETLHNGYEFGSLNFGYPANVDTFTITVERIVPDETTLINVSGLTPAGDADQLTCSGFPGNGGCDYFLSNTERDALIEGTYNWSVIATNTFGDMHSNQQFEVFRIDPDALTVGPWQFLWPLQGQTFVNNTTVSPILFTPAPNATTYEIGVDRTAPDYVSVFYSYSLTPKADTDPLTCTLRVCKLTLTAAQKALLIDGGEFNVWGWARNADDVNYPNDGGSVFYTNANAILPGAFYALNPVGNKVFEMNVQASTFTWTVSNGALSYDFGVRQLRPSWTEWVFGWDNLTPFPSDDALTCDATVCTLTVPPQEMAYLQGGGNFEWRVKAWSADGFTLPNVNDWSYKFTIDPNKQDLLKNGGFETAATNGVPTSWTRASATASNDKRSCDAATHIAFEGTCVLLFSGGANENVTFSQTVNGWFLRAAELDSTLTLRGFYKATGAPNLTLTATVTYTTPIGADKITLRVNKTSAGYVAIKGTNSIALRGDILKVKVTLAHKSLSGKIYLDGMSLILSSSNATRTDGWLPLPPSN